MTDDKTIDDLTPTQRAVHDMFWRCVYTGQKMGTRALSEHLGMSRGTVDSALKRLRAIELIPQRRTGCKLTPDAWTDAAYLSKYPGWRRIAPETPPQAFSVDTPPSALPSVDELIQAKIERFSRLKRHNDATNLVRVSIHTDGPVGVMFLGDPHIDDDGCDLEELKRDIDLCNSTDGLYAAHVGDLTNNWVGRLEAKYGAQSATIEEGALLSKWLINAAPWLFLVMGNHDLWNRGGMLVRELCDRANVYVDAHGVRVALMLPSGVEVRVNCRHDHSGHSQWNPGHGPLKALLFGDDHLYVAGHRHTSANGPAVRDHESGRIKYPLRVAGYKRYDDYARSLGLPNRRISGAALLVIDPRFSDDDPAHLTVFESTVQGARYLEFCRQQWTQAQPKRKCRA